MIARRLYGNAVIAAMLRGQRTIPFARREEIEAARDRRVRRTVAFAAQHVPFYREWFARGRADPREFTSAPDLERLPLLDRDEVRSEPHRFMATGHSALRVLTSGSTGAPLEVHHDRHSLLANIAWGERERQPLVEACGTFRPKEIYVGNETSVMKDVTAFYAANTRLPVRPRRRFVSVREQAETLAEIVNRERPDILVGYGGWIHLFFQTVAARGIALEPPKLVMYMAEALPPGGRELIEGSFGVPVMSRYSAAEAFKVGFYCECRTGFHLHEDLCHVRVLDDARLVISNLVNRGSVLLNYPIGDLGAISPEPCPCGRTFRVLSELEGRAEDILSLADGRFVHPRALWQVFREDPEVLQYRLVQEELQRFTLELATLDEPAYDRARHRAEPQLRRLLAPAPRIEFSRRAEVRREDGGKFRAVASRVPRR